MTAQAPAQAGFEPPHRPLGVDLRLFMRDERRFRLATGERAFLDMEQEDRGPHLAMRFSLSELDGRLRPGLDEAGVGVASDREALTLIARPLLGREEIQGIDLELTNATGGGEARTSEAAVLLGALLGGDARGWAEFLGADRQTRSTAGTLPVASEHIHEVLDFAFVENDEVLVRRDMRLAYGPQLALTIFSTPEPSVRTTNLGLGSRTKTELSTPGLIIGFSGPDRAATALEQALNHLEWTSDHLDSHFEAWEMRLVGLVTEAPDLADRSARLAALQRELATMLHTANATRMAQRTFARRLSTRTPSTSPHFHQAFREDGGRRLVRIAEVITAHRGRVREGFDLLNSVSAGVQTELAQQAQRDDNVFQQRIGTFAAALLVPSLFIAAFGANDVRLPSPAVAGWLVLVGGALLIGTLLPVALNRLSSEELLGRARWWLLACASGALGLLITGGVIAI